MSGQTQREHRQRDFLHELYGLNSQVAVVIGGTGVLGGALCEGLAQAGAYVIVAGRSQERGHKRVEAIRELGLDAQFAEVDATSRDSIKSLLDRVLGKHKKVDILVNCAGVNSSVPYEEISDEDWRRVIDSNLWGTHAACQIFAPQMVSQEQRGTILNIGSVTAHIPLSKVFAYSASKAAVVNLTQNTAREYAPKGVRINVLCPGFFPAEQNRKLLDKQRTANIIGQTPMGRFGEPHELVGPAIMLLSRTSGSFTTGEALYVDGGFTANRF